MVSQNAGSGNLAAPLLVMDSLPYALDNDCTQLPINPDEYMNTASVQNMLAREGLGEPPMAEGGGSAAAPPPAREAGTACTVHRVLRARGDFPNFDGG